MTPLFALGSLVTCLSLAPAAAAPLSDHSDTPDLISFARHDARITDFYAFTKGSQLVLVLCTDPTVAPGLSSYVFPSDLELEILIDNDSAVAFDDPDDLAQLGGTVLDPDAIRPDVKFRIRFKNGMPLLSTSGLSHAGKSGIKLFAGLRDDPFIRGPRIGRNVAAVVIELPLAAVLDGQSTLLAWATAKVPGLGGPFQELGARALRSQFPENDVLNVLDPKSHARVTGEAPDVVIFDTSAPASYPNGRTLEDDVVDLVGDPRVLGNDAPFPTENDVPFLTTFPWLAPPQ